MYFGAMNKKIEIQFFMARILNYIFLDMASYIITQFELESTKVVEINIKKLQMNEANTETPSDVNLREFQVLYSCSWLHKDDRTLRLNKMRVNFSPLLEKAMKFTIACLMT